MPSDKNETPERRNKFKSVSLELTAIIEIPNNITTTDATVLKVGIEDVSIADHASVPLATINKKLPTVPVNQQVPIKFVLRPEKVNEHATYSITAHLDMNGSGEPEKGDALTTQIYPVFTHGEKSTVRVRLTRI